jgi:trigger factor
MTEAEKAEAGTTDKENMKSEETPTDAAGSASTAGAEAQSVEEPGGEIKDAEVEAKETETEGSDTLVRFTITVPDEEVKKEIADAMDNYAAEAKVPGFRKGKVPMEVIKSRFNEAVRQELMGRIIEKTVLEKIEKEDIRIASTPRVLKQDYEEGKDLQADIEVEVLPTIELPELESIEVEIPSAELKPGEYNEESEIDAILERNRRQVPVDNREVRENDVVMLTYQSRILQTRRMTPKKTIYLHVAEKEESEILDLYKELPGKNPGDHFTLKQTYPDDYKKKPWAGKELEHYITIERVFEMEKPELNEAFLKSVGFEDAAVFKTKLKEEYDAYQRKQVEDKKLKFIVDKLVDTIAFTVPEALVAHEVSQILSQYPQGSLKFKDEEQAKMYMDILKKDAERSVRVSLITETLRDKYKVEVTNDDLEQEYKTIAEKNNLPLKEVRQAYMKKENMQQLKADFLNRKVVGLLTEKIKIKEV